MTSFRTIEVPGEAAIDELMSLRKAYPSSGEYPFLIGDREEVSMLAENAEFVDRGADAILAGASDVDVGAWIASRKADIEAEAAEFGEDPDLQGEWPGERVPKGEISLHRDVLSRQVRPVCTIGLAEVDAPWKLPAVLGYGGWNDCPMPEVHCAFFRHWADRYGAEPVGVSHDVIECTVAQPPQTEEEAMALAWEQYWYCYDIVEQGCETISVLAASLIRSPYWYFWWD